MDERGILVYALQHGGVVPVGTSESMEKANTLWQGGLLIPVGQRPSTTAPGRQIVYFQLTNLGVNEARQHVSKLSKAGKVARVAYHAAQSYGEGIRAINTEISQRPTVTHVVINKNIPNMPKGLSKRQRKKWRQQHRTVSTRINHDAQQQQQEPSGGVIDMNAEDYPGIGGYKGTPWE